MDWIMNLFSLLGRWPLLAESYPNLLKAPHSNFDRESISKRVVGECLRSCLFFTLFIKCILSTYPHSFPLYPIRSLSSIHTHKRKAAFILYPYGLVEKSIYTHDDDENENWCRQCVCACVVETTIMIEGW